MELRIKEAQGQMLQRLREWYDEAMRADVNANIDDFCGLSERLKP